MLAVTPAVLNETGEELGKEQGAQKLQRGVLRGDTTEVGAGLLPGKRQVDLVVGGDFVHQRVLEHRQAVAQSNGDVAPDLPVGQLENTIGRQRRVTFGQRLKAPLQIPKGLVGEHPVNGPERPLLNREQFRGAGDGLGCDIVHQSHEQIELRLFPKVLPLVGVGGILDDDLRDGLHQVFVLLNPAQAVPGITVFHVQKVEHPDLITLFPEKRGHTLVDLSLRIYTDQALLRAPFSSALKNKGLHKATGLARAGGAVHHDVLRQAAIGAQSHILSVLVIIVWIILQLAEKRSRQLRDGARQQNLLLFFLGHEAGGTVCAIGKNVKAAFVPDKLVAGKPDVALFGDETKKDKADCRDAQACGGKDGQQIAEWVDDPNGAHRIAGRVESRFDPQVDGVDEHSVKVPAEQPQRDIKLPLSLAAVEKTVQLLSPSPRNAVLQAGQFI